MQAGDEHIVESVARMQQVIELSRTIRERHAKPLKMPLRSLTVVAADASFLADLNDELKHYVLEEVQTLPHPFPMLSSTCASFQHQGPSICDMEPLRCCCSFWCRRQCFGQPQGAGSGTMSWRRSHPVCSASMKWSRGLTNSCFLF